MTPESTQRTRSLGRGGDGTQHVVASIVVDSDDEKLVRQLLAEATAGAGTPPRLIDEIGYLRLRLLEIDDIEAIVAQLPTTAAQAGAPSAGDALEQLMAWLRTEGPRRFGRVPQMGKERVVLAGESRPIPSPTKPAAAFGPFPDPTSDPLPALAEEVPAADLFPLVGVLDTSVVRKNQDFASVVALIPEDKELAPDDVKQAFQGHGTFVTGLVNARAPRAQIRVLPIIQPDGFATAWDAAKGMVDLAGEGMVDLKDARADIINMSFGTITGDDQPPFCLQRAVECLRHKVVLVAAVGNVDAHTQDPAAPVWPAALAGVLGVGSITKQGVPSAFSPQEPWVDVVAVGENVRGTFISGDVLCPLDGGGSRKRRFWGTAIWSGTSFAAATVTGRLAYLAAKQLADATADVRAGSRVEIIRGLADQLRTGQRRDGDVRQP